MPYRGDFSGRVERVETRRRALGISQEALAFEAGIAPRTWRRIVGSGLAFERTVLAAERGVAGLERRAASAQDAFPTEDSP